MPRFELFFFFIVGSTFTDTPMVSNPAKLNCQGAAYGNG